MNSSDWLYQSDACSYIIDAFCLYIPLINTSLLETSIAADH